MIPVQTVIKMSRCRQGSSWEQIIKYTNHFAHFVTLFYSLLFLKLLFIPTGIELQNRSVYGGVQILPQKVCERGLIRVMAYAENPNFTTHSANEFSVQIH